MFFALRKPEKANDVHIAGVGRSPKDAFMDAWSRSWDDAHWGHNLDPFDVARSTLLFAKDRASMMHMLTPGCDTCKKFLTELDK